MTSLADLEAMDREGLASLWSDLIGGEVPACMSQPMQRRFLSAPDAVLQRTLAEAHNWARALRAGISLTEIARETGRSEPYIRTRIPLAFLAPKLQAAILDGRQPADLSLAKLVRDGIPMDWADQARLFGIA